MKTNELIRHASESSESVVLVGNGAIENGWMPLREVLDPRIHDGDETSRVVKNIQVQNCETFHQLAMISYRFKFYRAEILRKLMDREVTLSELEKKGWDPIVEEFIGLRNAIGESYQKKRRELSLKVSDDIRKLIGEKALFITTNWDETLWNEEHVKSVAYLHGRCSHPQSIVFPTELLIDDTLYDPTSLPGFDETSPRFRKTLEEIFRFRAIRKLMDTIGFANEAITNAKRIVVWGFNLADYDADINTLLAMNTHDGQELVVINPEFTSFARAVGLTGLTKAIHYNPETELRLKLDSA